MVGKYTQQSLFEAMYIRAKVKKLKLVEVEFARIYDI